MGNRKMRKEYKTQLLKEGLKMETEKNSIYTRYTTIDRCPEWPMYVDVPLKKPEFWGIRISLELIPTIKQKELAGLSEAIEACSHYLEFSGRELRWCNLKNKWVLQSDNDSIKDLYFNEHKEYIAGKLDLGKISEQDYNKLSDDAKKWFKPNYFVKTYWNGWTRKGWEYEPKIPSTFLKEKREELYITHKRHLNWERESRQKWLETKLEQELLEYKVWHEFKHYKNSDRWYRAEYRMTSRKFKRKYQKEKLSWAEEASELV